MEDLQPKNVPTIRDLGGHIVDLRRFTREDNKNWGATNPSIGYHPKKGLAVAIRSSNYVIDAHKTYRITEGKFIQSEVWFSELDANLKLRNLRKINLQGTDIDITRGMEDPKLFWRDGAWHFTCVILEGHTPVARMAVAKLDAKCTKVVSATKYPGVEYRRPEKNWMVAYEPNPHFDFVYAANATIKNNKLTTYMNDHKELSMLRGSSNLHLLGNKTYLAVLHRKHTKIDPIFSNSTFASSEMHNMQYYHYFAQYDYYGNITGISKPFIFHKLGVEFASGIVMRGKEFLISFGRDDVSSHIASLPVKTVLESIQPIKY